MSSGSGSRSAAFDDYDATKVVVVDADTIRTYPNVSNVVNLQRRLHDQVVCLTLIPCAETDRSHGYPLFVDSVASIPDMSPGLEMQYAVLGDARIGSEWRKANDLGEPRLPPVGAECLAVLQLPDLTTRQRISRRGWGVEVDIRSQEHGSSTSSKADADADVADGDTSGADDDNEENDNTNREDGRSGTGSHSTTVGKEQFLLIVHPRGRSTLVRATVPPLRQVDSMPEKCPAGSIECRLCLAYVPSHDMHKPCVFHPGRPVRLPHPSQTSSGVDANEQLLTPASDCTFGSVHVAEDSSTGPSDDHQSEWLNDNVSDDGKSEYDDFWKLRENWIYSCCNRPGNESGCMVEVSHMSEVADERFRDTWKIPRAEEDAADA
ncbi:unnamed protein product [Zymoseptoria tritici ST99CH_1A5]|uniref:Uncharacterized protein n=2 Tax=Zymoseptoria tritici TaxID=1047171 RepID=A0A2H1GNF0_ZYMTR|nr:unnamed protein product [Zymoseptoria tritici ST99CH_1E4]SMY25876.1 unnamed protein product [Zymoseptoria tritici ST99CH_1A5]